MNTKKIILIAVVVVVVVGAGIWLFAGSQAKHKVTYATATVSKGDISKSVTATGTIEPVTEVEAVSYTHLIPSYSTASVAQMVFSHILNITQQVQHHSCLLYTSRCV